MKAPDSFFNNYFANNGDIFDRASYDLCMQHVKDFDIAIDCGAHVGSWTKAMAGRFKHVYAFEPNNINHSFLVENLDGISNVTFSRFAIGDIMALVSMQQGHENSGQSHVISGDNVAMSYLDERIRHEDHARISFLKLDIEGYELQALMGARSILAQSNPVIMVELNGLGARYGVSDKQVMDYLHALGYNLAGVANKDHVYVR